VQRAAVQQPMDIGLGIMEHPQRPEEVTLAIDHAATGVLRQTACQQDTARREGEPDRPAQARHARVRSQSTGQGHSDHPRHRFHGLIRVYHQKRRQPVDNHRQNHVGEPIAEPPNFDWPEAARRYQAGQDHDQGVFDQAIENHRCHQRIEDSTQNPPQGDRQVKGCCLLRLGPRGRKLTVANQGPDEKDEQVQRNPEQVREPHTQHQHQRNHQQGKQGGSGANPPSRGWSKRQDVRHQVNPQGDRPEQGDRREVGGDVSGEPQQPARGDESQRNPLHDSPCGDEASLDIHLPPRVCQHQGQLLGTPGRRGQALATRIATSPDQCRTG